MSISLDIEKYCEDCADFEPNVDIFKVEDYGGSFNYITTIECKNKDRCKSIYHYLLNYLEKKGEKND